MSKKGEDDRQLSIELTFTDPSARVPDPIAAAPIVNFQSHVEQKMNREKRDVIRRILDFAERLPQ